LLAHAALRYRVDQQGEGHSHQQPFDPAGLFDKQRRDKKAWGLKKAQASFDTRRAFVGRNDRGIAQLAAADIGAQDTASLDVLAVSQCLLIRPDAGLEVPLDGLQRGAGVGQPLPA